MKNLITPLHRVLSLILCIAFSLIAQNVAAQLTITLTSTGHNGYNISCFGMQDGNITANVTGGTPPYTYQWSNQATTPTISNLAPGYYHVNVTDNSNTTVEAELTLTQTEPFKVPSFSVSNYPNGKNVSCYYCFDGYMATSVETGIAPFSFAWSDGPTTQDRTNIFAGQYEVVVTDANGCTVSGQVTVTKPDRDDWTMSGNSGTNSSFNYIGTSDAKDLVFKTKGTEALRIDTTGSVKFNNLIDTTYNLVVADPNGNLRRLDVTNQPDPGNPIAPVPWYTTGNNISTGQYIGPKNNKDFIFKTGQGTTLAERMRITTDGKVIIGTGLNLNTVFTYGLYVGKGILTEKVKVAIATTNDWNDHVFDANYKLLPLNELKTYLEQNKHLPDIPSAQDLVNEGAVDLGQMIALLVKKAEEQTLYILKQQEQIDALNKKIEKLQDK